MATATKCREKVHEISMREIEADADLQPRAEIDQETVADYSAAMLDGAEFPPVALFFDGVRYWLADGFHRYRAALKAGIKALRAIVYQGGKEEALLHSLGANSSHGLRRSRADKQRVVRKVLDHPEWHRWTDTEIARRCNVSTRMVSLYRHNAGTLGEGAMLRIDGAGNLHDATPRNGTAHAPAAAEPPPRFSIPPTPMTKADLRDTYVRKIASHLRKQGGQIEVGVKTPHGTVDFASEQAAYLFTTCLCARDVHEATGRAVILSATLGKSRVVVVGTLARTVAHIIRDAEAAVPGLSFTTPESLIARKEG